VTLICVFGLGEAGFEIATDLVEAGATVAGFDPAPVETPAGVNRHDDPASAVDGAQVVMAVTAASDARTALEQALARIPAGSHYADVSTAAPALKRDLARVAARAGLVFTDVALMGIVKGRGARTPALASGPAAQALVELVEPLGMNIRVVGSEPGFAATHKLVRSVFMKGLAAVLIESMRAAAAAGLAEETWGEIVDEVGSADEAFLRRLIFGTQTHATRRTAEMEAAAELLTELGVAPTMTRSVIAGLKDVMHDGVPHPPTADKE